MKRSLHFFALALLPLLFSNCQCTPDPNCVEFPGGKKYECSAPVSIVPAKETYHTGDTIRVTVLLPDSLPELSEGRKLNISALSFEGFFSNLTGFAKDSTNIPFAYNPEAVFSYYPVRGNVSVVGAFRYLELFFEQTASGRICVFDLIPQQAGVYDITFFTPFALSTGKFDDICYSETQLYFSLDSTVDTNNYHLLLPYSELVTGKINEKKLNAGFAFVVQ